MTMRLLLTFILLACFGQVGHSLPTDTLHFNSDAFEAERHVVLHIPDDYKYQSESVQLPIIYVLDGQHEWFVNPTVNTIQYMKYVYEMPNALIVEIPLYSRNKECSFSGFEGEGNALYRFITSDIEGQLNQYHPNDYRLIIGHSFSASFALYAFTKGNGFFTSVIAHTPKDQLEAIVDHMSKNDEILHENVCISAGSPDSDKDMHHRRTYDEVKLNYPDFFSKIHSIESDYATHNATPIVSNPQFMSELFYLFSRRFGAIAKVDLNYKLEEEPGTVEEEMEKIRTASVLGPYYYPPEIGEYFGLASRYSNSNYIQHAIKVIEQGIEDYPKLFDFHYELFYLYIDSDSEKAKFHLLEAKRILLEVEPQDEYTMGVLQDINKEILARNW